MRVPGIPQPALVALIVVAAALFVFGAGKASGLLTKHAETHTRTMAAARTLVVAGRTGDIQIVAADRSDIRLTTKEQRSMWGGGHAKVLGDARGLRLDDHCRGLPLVDDPCNVNFLLEVPGAPPCA
jgi:hypothetical protein